MVNLLCFILLFSHQYFFITIITSLLYIFAFYAVSDPEGNLDVCGQEVKVRCEAICTCINSGVVLLRIVSLIIHRSCKFVNSEN